MDAERTRRRTLTAGIGVLLIAAGIGLLGWLAWQLFGTSYLSQKQHDEIVGQLEREWSGGSARTGESAQEGQRVQAVRTDHGDARAIVRIPRFGDDYAVPVLSGTSDEVLAAGLGHFQDSAGPGEVGNFALAGHRVTHAEPLRNMPSLQPGDQVIVETGEATYTYELTTGGDDLEVTFSDIWVVQPRPKNPDPDGVSPPRSKRLITLTTCAELFHTDERLIAFGKLVDTQQR